MTSLTTTTTNSSTQTIEEYTTSDSSTQTETMDKPELTPKVQKKSKFGPTTLFAFFIMAWVFLLFAIHYVQTSQMFVLSERDRREFELIFEIIYLNICAFFGFPDEAAWFQADRELYCLTYGDLRMGACTGVVRRAQVPQTQHRSQGGYINMYPLHGYGDILGFWWDLCKSINFECSDQRTN
jgi:hypothetical protein